MKKFTVGEALKVGWEKTRQHFGFLVLVMFGSWFATFIVSQIGGSGRGHVNPGRSLLGFVLSFVVSMLVQIGIIRISLKILNDVQGGFRDFIPTAQLFWRMVGGTILYGLIVLLGSILGIAALLVAVFGAVSWAAHISPLVFVPAAALVVIALFVPGLVLAIKYRLYSYLIVDKNMKAVEAIKESGRLTQGEKLNLFWFALASVGIVLLGLLALVVGLLWATPTVTIAFAYVYRKLSAGAPAVSGNPQ